jgi:hypothetical protein
MGREWVVKMLYGGKRRE